MTQQVEIAEKSMSLKHADLQDNRPARAKQHPIATDDLFYGDQMFRLLESYRRWPERRQQRLCELAGS